MTQDINVTEFAKFIGQPVSIARKILEQEDRERQVHGSDDIHDGYNYHKQEWVK